MHGNTDVSIRSRTGRCAALLMALAVLFSLVVIPGSVAAADGDISDETVYAVIIIVVIAVLIILGIVFMSGKKTGTAPASAAAKALAKDAAPIDTEPGVNKDGVCSKCGAPMLVGWEKCPRCTYGEHSQGFKHRHD